MYVCTHTHTHTHTHPAQRIVISSSQMYGMAVANKLDNNQNILQRRYFRQVREAFKNKWQ